MTRLPHRVAPVLALALVNVFGTLGQYQWAYRSFGHDSVVAVGFAATLESISLFLTAEASSAMLADVRSGLLRLGAYALGALVGAMNYVAHAGPHWRPTATAIAFGALSTLSPILWTIHTRGVHRKALQAKGLVDPRAVKFPLAVWVLDFRTTFRMFRLGVIAGINEPATVRTIAAERAALARLAPVDALRYAFGQLGHFEPHAARVWLQARGVLVDQAAIDQATAGRPAPVRAPAMLAPVSPAGPGPAALPDPEQYHREQLAACLTNRDRIRYAFSALGDYRPADAVRWLSARDVTVSRTEAYTVAKEAAGAGPSGGYPAVPTSPAPAGAATRTNGHALALAIVNPS